MKKLTPLLLFVAVVLTILAGGAFWYQSHQGGPTDGAEQNKLTTLPLGLGHLHETVSGTGVVQPHESVVVSVEVSGRVNRLYKDHGDTVKEGDELLLIDDTDARLKLERAQAAKRTAEAGLKAAEADVEKAKSIHEAAQTELDDAKKGDFPKSQLRIAEAKVKAGKAAVTAAEAGVKVAQERVTEAEAAIKHAEHGVALTVVRVPFVERPSKGAKRHANVIGQVLPNAEPGRPLREFTVLERKVALNQLVGPPAAAHAFTLSGGPEWVEVHAQISEGDIARVAVGQEAVFTVSAYPDDLFKGKVVEIRPVPANIQGGVFYTVVIDTENRRDKANQWYLRPGMPTSSLDIIHATHSGPDGKGQWLAPNAALDYPLDEHYHAPGTKDQAKPVAGWHIIWIQMNGRTARPVHVKVGPSGKYLEAAKDQDSAYTVVEAWDPAGEEPSRDEAMKGPKGLPALVINAEPPKKSRWSGLSNVLRLQ